LVKIEIINVIGEMRPCQKPLKKPATLPFSSGVFSSLFGPAAQLGRIKKRIRQIPIVLKVFNISPLLQITVKRSSFHS